jgi:hypothetical protein
VEALKMNDVLKINLFEKSIRDFIRENPDIKLFEIEKIFSDVISEFCENNQAKKRRL